MIDTIEPRGKDVYLRIQPDAESLRYIVHKGCVSIDGISLTVAEVDETGFSIWLIPHTMEATNLHSKKKWRPGEPRVRPDRQVCGKAVRAEGLVR